MIMVRSVNREMYTVIPLLCDAMRSRVEGSDVLADDWKDSTATTSHSLLNQCSSASSLLD